MRPVLHSCLQKDYWCESQFRRLSAFCETNVLDAKIRSHLLFPVTPSPPFSVNQWPQCCNQTKTCRYGKVEWGTTHWLQILSSAAFPAITGPQGIYNLHMCWWTSLRKTFYQSQTILADACHMCKKLQWDQRARGTIGSLFALHARGTGIETLRVHWFCKSVKSAMKRRAGTLVPEYSSVYGLVQRRKGSKVGW